MTMKNCPTEETIGRWFDGEAADADVDRHVANCTRCGEYAETLRMTRAALAERPAVRIENSQMPAYLNDLRGGIHRRRMWGRVWAGVSLAAAAVVAATALLTVVTQGPTAVQAHSVLEAHSDITGATTETIEYDNGTMTVWLNLPEDDMQ